MERIIETLMYRARWMLAPIYLGLSLALIALGVKFFQEVIHLLSGILTLKESGVVEVDRFSLETSREKFYAGGDVISGASNVSNAMGYGKKAARNIDQRLMGTKRFSELMRTYEYDQTPPAQPSAAGRQIPDNVPARERVKTFHEVSLGLTVIEALEEANRCLRCDIRATDR